MPEAADHRTLRASRPVRRLAQFSGCLGALIGCLYAVMGLMSHGVRLLIPVLLVLLILVVRPLLILSGRTVLGYGAILVRRPPVTRAIVPGAVVALVETRRGPLLEWPVLWLRDGRLMELGAPLRFWFIADPAYDRDLARLRALTGHVPVAGPVHRWSVTRLAAGPALVLAAFALIFIDPPWASDAWPLRPHAHRLPDACRMFDASARRLLPGATVDRAFSYSDDSDKNVKRHACQWNATHPSPDGTRFVDVGRLSVQIELDHGIGPVSDAQEAHRAFARQIRLRSGGTEVKVPRTGDEAELITQPAAEGFAWVTVAVRKANVEEKIDLIYQGRARTRDAAHTAEGLARLGLSEIRFR
jgi:hypothetical protein